MRIVPCEKKIFYKGVMDNHITGAALFVAERSGGIMREGLDPRKRNASGGATQVALAQTGRQFSPADKTGWGQCLTGDYEYAKDYCTSDNHRMLRVSLPDYYQEWVVVSSADKRCFATFEAAVDAKECTVIAKVLPIHIEYELATGGWAPISGYSRTLAKKDWAEDSDSDWD